MKKLVLVLVLTTFTFGAASAQQEVRRKSGPRRQLATIVFAGLGGAILGLSTLSFYGRPQDQLGNIAIGFAVGVIAGTAYVTFRSATTREYYEDPSKDPNAIPPRGVLLPVEEEPKMVWAPLIKKEMPQSEASLGAQAILRF